MDKPGKYAVFTKATLFFTFSLLAFYSMAMGAPLGFLADTPSALVLHLSALSFILSFALFRRPGSALLNAAAATGVVLLALSSIDFSSAAVEERLGFKVLSFNILDNNDAHRDDIASFVVEQEADFVFLQESQYLRASLAVMQAHYPYSTYAPGDCAPQRKCKTLLLSKYPIELISRDLGPRKHDRFLHAVARFQGHRINLIGVHFGKSYTGRLQQSQMEQVAAYISSLDGPVLVAGDFNAVPWMPVLRRFVSQSALGKPKGYHPTWPVWLRQAGFQIDHILTNGRLEILEEMRGQHSLGSNHLPVMAAIQLNQAGLHK